MGRIRALRRSSIGGAIALVLVAAVQGSAAHGATEADAGLTGVAAPSFVAVDAVSGQVLAARGEAQRRPIASLTKVMTGLVAIERGDLLTKVRVTAEAVNVEDYREGLVAGRRYKRITLLRSALMVSGNDSATALAIDGGGGSLQRFYDLMNERARAAGLTSTTYASASGLNDVTNLSTALDQAKLARIALRNQTFAAIVSTKRFATKWAAPTRRKVWVNHNRMLLWTPGTYGVKTGWTTRAGGCLIVAQRRGDRAVIGVLLASPSVWSDMERLLDVAFSR